MAHFKARTLICLIWIGLLGLFVKAQEHELISADNLERLRSVQHIDYADFDTDIDIGWFAVSEDASELIVFDNDSNVYAVPDGGDYRSWTYVNDPKNEIFSMIDAVYFRGTKFILYVINDIYYVNSQQLDIDGIPVSINLAPDIDFLYVEAILDDGQTIIYEYATMPITNSLNLVGPMPYPLTNLDEPLMRVGRIDLPNIIASSLEDETIQFYYSDFSFYEHRIENGPAVFGAVNQAYRFPTYFAWVDPNSTYLNLLDLVTGENRIVAELNRKYAQYYLLSQDASLVIAVNVDFVPNVFAWDVQTGEHYDLGAYRECNRIPDKVEISDDGTTLIIGCDTGLDIWRISDETESE